MFYNQLTNNQQQAVIAQNLLEFPELSRQAVAAWYKSKNPKMRGGGGVSSLQFEMEKESDKLQFVFHFDV